MHTTKIRPEVSDQDQVRPQSLKIDGDQPELYIKSIASNRNISGTRYRARLASLTIPRSTSLGGYYPF
jgi:hypothetical protein